MYTDLSLSLLRPLAEVDAFEIFGKGVRQISRKKQILEDIVGFSQESLYVRKNRQIFAKFCIFPQKSVKFCNRVSNFRKNLQIFAYRSSFRCHIQTRNSKP